MSYLLDRKIQRKRRMRWGFVIIFLAAFLFFREPIFEGFSSVGLEIFRPILVVGNGAGSKFKNFGAYFSSKNSLQKENNQLRSRLEENEARLLNHDALEDENEILKEMLGRKREDYKFVLAGVLSKPNQSAYDTILVDAGSDEGIKEGDMVYAYGYVPVGRVAHTTFNSAKIILFSGAGESMKVILSSRENTGEESGSISYDLVGRGGGNFEMIIPRDINIKEGDQVVLPGVNLEVVAKVESVVSDIRDPFKKVLLLSPINLFELRFVEIKIS